MIDESQLKELLAPMLLVAANDIGRDTSLSSLDNSIGEAKLRAALKRFAVEMPDGLRPPTFGAFYRLVSGVVPEPAVQPAIKSSVTPLDDLFQQLSIGLDVQDIASLP